MLALGVDRHTAFLNHPRFFLSRGGRSAVIIVCNILTRVPFPSFRGIVAEKLSASLGTINFARLLLGSDVGQRPLRMSRMLGGHKELVVH